MDAVCQTFQIRRSEYQARIDNEVLERELINVTVMLTKAQIFDTVEELPEQVTLDELIDKLMFIEKVNIGLAQSENGMVCSEEEAEKRLCKWLR